MTGTELDSSKMKGMSMKAGLNRWDSWRKCAQVSFKSWEKFHQAQVEEEGEEKKEISGKETQ